jgi:O-antigen/teichoic acid export membrane protein
MGMTFPILTIPTTLIGSLATALIPEIATLLKQNNKAQLKQQINTSILFTMCCSFLCFAVFLPLSYPVCELLFNNLESGNYLFYSIWTIIPTGISAITTSILNSLGQEKYTFRYFIYSAVLSILAIFIMPKFIGIHTLFVSIGLSATLTYILNVFRINKTLNINLSNKKNLFILVIISLPCALLTKWIYNIFHLIYGNIVAIILSSIICVVCFILLLISFNLIDVKVILSSLKTKKVNQKVR